MSAITDDAMTFFIGRGLKHHQAAAVVGGLQQESGADINPTLSHDSGTGFGVAGFRDTSPGVGRWTNLKRYAASNGLDINERRTQYAFMLEEADGPEKAAWDQIRGAADIETAAEGMMRYERPQGFTSANPRGGHGWINRLNNAVALTGAHSGEVAPAPEGTNIFTPAGNPYAGMSSETPFTPQERAERDNPNTPYESVWQDAAASEKSDWALPWALRELGRGAVDPDYEMPTERFNELTKALPSEYHDYVLDSHSDEDEASRLKWAQEDMVRQSKLSAGGWSTAGIRLLSNVIDPTFIAAAVATEGVAIPLLGVAKASRIGRILFEGAATGAAEGAATAATASINPTIDEGDVWASIGFGALVGGTFGALRSNVHTQAEADAMAAMGRSLLASTAIPTPAGSVGAAVNPEFRAPFMASTPILDDKDITGAAFGGARFDAAGQLGSSDDALSRLAAPHMGEEAIGNRDHSAVADAATTVQKIIDGKHMASWEAVSVPAFNKWVSEAGLGSQGKRSKAWATFNEQVTDYVEEAAPSPGQHSPHVVAAANEFRRVMKEYAELMSNPQRDVGGTGRPVADVPSDPNYVAKYGDHDAIHDIHNKFDRPALLNFIEQAIYKRAATISPEIAKRIAKGWLDNITKAGFGIEDGVSMAIAKGDKDALREMMSEIVDGKVNLLLSEDDITNLMDEITGLGKKPGDSGLSRTRRRTLFDYAHKNKVRGKDGQFHDLSMRDFFVKDADMIVRRYSRQVSGRVALAQIQVRHPRTKELIVDGITSTSEFEKFLNHVRDTWSQKAGTMGQAQIDAGKLQDIENFKYLWDAVTGTPHYNPRSQVYQWIKRVRKFNFVRLMNRMGISQSQEFARMIGTLGFKATFSQVPAFRRIINNAGRSVVKDDRMLQELHARTGMGSSRFAGNYSQAYGGRDLDVDAMDAQAYQQQKFGRVARGLDKLLDKGGRITANISLMKHIHGIQQDWTMKAISQRLYDMARATEVKGAPTATPARVAELEKLVRINTNQLEQFEKVMAGKDYAEAKVKGGIHFSPYEWLERNAKAARVGIKKYKDELAAGTQTSTSHDLTKLKGSDQNRLRAIGMADEDMIAVFKEMRKHGTTSKGSKLDELQLDNWDPMVEGRFIKSLVRYTDRIIHENDPGNLNRWMSQPIVQMMTQFRTFIIGSWAKSTLYNLHNFDARTFATMSLEVMAGASTWALTQGIANAGDPEKLNELFTLQNLVLAGIGRAPFASLLAPGVDTAVTFATPYGAPFQSIRNSGSPSDIWFGNPSADIVGNMASFIDGITSAATGGGPISQQALKAGTRVSPFGNFLPFSAVFGAMIQGQPKYTPRAD